MCPAVSLKWRLSPTRKLSVEEALGVLKMKEAFWSVDRSEGGRFSDFEPGSVDQASFLPQFVLYDELTHKYRGQTVPMTGLERFVIEETDYLPKPCAPS